MKEPGYCSPPVAQSTEYDVLMGRGKGSDGHSGNVAFRHLVWSHRAIYLHASNIQKREIAERVVNAVIDRQGRFLQRGTDEENNDCFYVVSWAVAINKTLQALRELSATEPLVDRLPAGAPPTPASLPIRRAATPKPKKVSLKSRTKGIRTPRAMQVSAAVQDGREPHIPSTVEEPTVVEPTVVEPTVALWDDLSLVMEPWTPSVGCDLSNVFEETAISDIEVPWLDVVADWMPRGDSLDPEPLLRPDSRASPTGVTLLDTTGVAAYTHQFASTGTLVADAATMHTPLRLPVPTLVPRPRPMCSSGEDAMVPVSDTAATTRAETPSRSASVGTPVSVSDTAVTSWMGPPPTGAAFAVTPMTVTSMGPPVGVALDTAHSMPRQVTPPSCPSHAGSAWSNAAGTMEPVSLYSLVRRGQVPVPTPTLASSGPGGSAPPTHGMVATDHESDLNGIPAPVWPVASATEPNFDLEVVWTSLVHQCV